MHNFFHSKDSGFEKRVDLWNKYIDLENLLVDQEVQPVILTLCRRLLEVEKRIEALDGLKAIVEKSVEEVKKDYKIVLNSGV